MPIPTCDPLWPGHKPDFSRLETVVRRSGLPDRVPFVELFADPEVISAILGETYIPYDLNDRSQTEACHLQRIRFCCKVGWDFVWLPVALDFKRELLPLEDTADLASDKRQWQDESSGVIQTSEEFEGYPWPRWSSINEADFEFVASSLPDGMKIIFTTGGVLEWVMWLMGFTPFSLALYDQPALIEAMFRRVGDILADAVDKAAGLPGVGAYFLGDDMGYKTGTFIKHEQMRKYLFPQQKRLAEITHKYGLPFLLHACGNLEKVMEDLIEYVGIDGKHSFEDVIMPVSEFKKKYGDRISVLGGVDVDFLATHSPDEVRAYTRRVLEACMPGGGYGLGTGNSVANYIPVENYLAMLDEGYKVGWY
jgi:uroporphyrinogen decarboxylase